MQSLNVVFVSKDTVESRHEHVAELSRGQVLVQSLCSLISTGTECICLQQNFAPGTHWHDWIKYPFYPGYNNVGRIIALGSDVHGLNIGQRVAVREQHRQFFATSPELVVPVPNGVSNEEAAWFGMATIVQTGVRRAVHELGDVVVVVGAGLLGQLVTQYVRLLGAREIIVIDTASARLKMAHEHGATQILQLTADKAVEVVSNLTHGRMADVVYDVTGHPAVFPSALRMVKNLGKMILLGDAGNPSEQRLTADVITRGLQIIGAHDRHSPAEASDFAYWTKRNMASLFFDYLQRKQMSVSEMITHRYNPAEASKAYQMLITDRASAMGVIFDWTQLPPA